MTMPDERTRAVIQTRKFLLDLASGEIKRIPSEVRQLARILLKHYPGSFDMKRANEALPNTFGELDKETDQ